MTEIIKYLHVALKLETLDPWDGIFLVLKAFITGQKYPSILIVVPALRALCLPLSSVLPPPSALSSETIPAETHQERVIFQTVSNLSSTSFFSLCETFALKDWTLTLL